MQNSNSTENKECMQNWTEDKKPILLEEYGERKNILQSRFKPSITHVHKTKTWHEITEKINSRNLLLLLLSSTTVLSSAQ